jgi:type II secretory pathway component PulC
MKILIILCLMSFSVLAKEGPKNPPAQVVQETKDEKKLNKLKQCKFSDWGCKRRNERPVSRKLKRLSRF